MNKPSHPHERDSGAIDLIALLDVIWRSRRLVWMTSGAIFALGLAYAFLATPIYRSDLLVQIENNGDSAGAQLLGSLSDYLGVKSNDDAEMQILRSRRVVGAAVDRTRYDIVAEPKRFPVLGRYFRSQGLASPDWFGLRGYAWGTERIEVERFDVPEALYGETFTVTILADRNYRIASSHLPEAMTGEFGKSMHFSTDAGDAVLHIDGVQALPGTAFVLRRQSHQQAIADLQKRLAIVGKAKDAGIITVSLDSAHPRRVADLLNALGDAYVQLNSEQKAEQARKSLEFLDQHLPVMKQELQHDEDALLAYRKRHGVIDLSESAKLQLGQQVALQTRISQLSQDRQGKLEQFMPRHPDIVAIDAQMHLLQRELQQLEKQVKLLPETEQAMVGLMRNVRVSTELYVAMLNSMQQLRLLRAGKVGNVHVLDHAEPPELPIRPRRLLVILASFLLSLFVGVSAALLRSLWKGSVTDPRAVEDLLDLPVVATVPQAKTPGRGPSWRRLRKGVASRLPLAAVRPYEPAVESLQGLAIAIQLHIVDARNNIILVTSATPSVGKTFTSTNIAILLARAGRRVLLVDGDLRLGGLEQYFHAKPVHGLIDVLAGRASLDTAIIESGIKGLNLLCNGGSLVNPNPLLQSARLDSCLAEWSSRYDLVVVDTAPILPVADTLALARRAGSTYIVARYGITSEDELREVRLRLARTGVPLAGVVLNGVQASLHGSVYANYGYGYGYANASQ